MTLENVLQEFRRFKMRQGLSDASIHCYVSFVMPFLSFVGGEMDLLDIQEEHIQGYIDSLYDREISKATRATYVRHLKVFFNWIKKYKGIDLYTGHIIVPKSNKKILRIYSDEDIEMIFQVRCV